MGNSAVAVLHYDHFGEINCSVPRVADAMRDKPSVDGRSIEHHRQMEHHAVMQEQSDRHSKAMEWNRVERERIAELRAAKNWWLEPLNAACKWCGGAFWCVVWFWVIVSVSSAISDANKATNERLAKAAITSCLADLDACKRGVGGAWMKEAVR